MVCINATKGYDMLLTQYKAVEPIMTKLIGCFIFALSLMSISACRENALEQAVPAPSIYTSGLVYWLGCGATIDQIERITSCPIENGDCSALSNFYTYAKNPINVCKAQNRIIALWIELDQQNLTEPIWNDWAKRAKDVLAFLKTNNESTDTSEASLRKLMAVVSQLEGTN